MHVCLLRMNGLMHLIYVSS
uniref:Uncharacterized protein n=1 Tax=Nymphaea colorata TaxID=210225 RepID=A0A5K1BEG6_9MAGN